METTQPRPVRVLVVDGEPASLKALEALLREKGWEVVALDSTIAAVQRLAAEDFDVLLLDIDIATPQLCGLELLAAVKHRRPEVEIVTMIGQAKADTVELVEKVSQAAERKVSADRFRERLAPSDEELVGTSVVMRDVMRRIDAVACSSAPVLVCGEAGTGMELVVGTLHRKSPRRSQPFVECDCYAPTETLQESKLFGHVKGAFAGALSDQKGLSEAADGGTLFLDMICDLSLATQGRVLRLLQEGVIKRVGSDESIRVDVRVIATTHRDVPMGVKAGRLSEDLFKRFNVIDIPPLRDRLEDVPLLAHHFLRRYANRLGKKVSSFSPEAMGLLCRYRWPQNIRELENVIERAVVLCRGGVIIPADLTPAIVEEQSR